MNDYEHAGFQRRLAFRRARVVMAPEAIPAEAMERAGARAERAVPLPGAEGGLLPRRLPPDPEVFADVGLDRLGFGADGADPVLVVVRPRPRPRSTTPRTLCTKAVIDRLGGSADAIAVVIPRTEGQASRLRERGMPSLVIPGRAVDAQSLIAYADLVVSAGGHDEP